MALGTCNLQSVCVLVLLKREWRLSEAEDADSFSHSSVTSAGALHTAHTGSLMSGAAVMNPLFHPAPLC